MRLRPLQRGLSQALQLCGPSFPGTYQRLLPAAVADAERSFSTRSPSVTCTTVKSGMSADESEDFARSMSGRFGAMSPGRLDLANKAKVQHVQIEDITPHPGDEYGQILVISGPGSLSVRYGDHGVAPSATVAPLDLLKHEVKAPQNSVVVFDIRNHVPFLIDSDNPRSFALATCQLNRVPDHGESIGRYSMNTMCELKPEQAKQLSLALQNKIFHDRKNEYFYEEVTSKVYPPTEYNKSSGTLMNFSNLDPKQEGTTATHYHPGERSLIVVTTGKKAGATLNFCGIAENPDERKDCEQRVEFPPNSIIVLNFPPYTHHKFHGDFDCMSVHPREGANLIRAVQSGTLTRGFLESATVFSRTDKDPERYQLSLPEQQDKSSDGDKPSQATVPNEATRPFNHSLDRGGGRSIS